MYDTKTQEDILGSVWSCKYKYLHKHFLSFISLHTKMQSTEPAE